MSICIEHPQMGYMQYMRAQTLDQSTKTIIPLTHPPSNAKHMQIALHLEERKNTKHQTQTHYEFTTLRYLKTSKSKSPICRSGMRVLKPCQAEKVQREAQRQRVVTMNVPQSKSRGLAEEATRSSKAQTDEPSPHRSGRGQIHTHPDRHGRTNP